MYGAAGVVIDSINRQKNNRSLVKKDRGAFDIKERNRQFKTRGIQGIYKKASPTYMAQLRAQIKEDKANRRRMLVIKLSILGIIITGLSYLAWGYTF